jgi:N-formylmaleamate deformylase
MRFIVALLCMLPVWCQPLAYGKAGKGPGLVLIHGFAGNRGVFAEWQKPFTDKRMVVSVDLPGCGQSQAQETVDLDAIADQVAKLMASERLERSVLVAHSMGGLIALRVAARHADQVSGLVLIDSPLLPLGQDQAESLAKAFEKDPAGTFRARYGAFTSDEDQLERVVRDAAKVSGRVLADYTRARTVSSSAYISKVKCPVLLLASPVLIPDATQQEPRLREAGYAAFSQFQAVRLGNAKHWIMWDEMALSQQAVREFISNLEK